jgi:hypothetical protein
LKRCYQLLDQKKPPLNEGQIQVFQWINHLLIRGYANFNFRSLATLLGRRKDLKYLAYITLTSPELPFQICSWLENSFIIIVGFQTQFYLFAIIKIKCFLTH